MKYGWYCRDFRQFPESSLHHVWSHTQRILAGGGASSYWEGKPLVCHLDQHQWFKFAHCQLFFVRISMYFVYIIIIDSVDTLSSSRANQGRKFQRGKSYKPKKEFAYKSFSLHLGVISLHLGVTHMLTRSLRSHFQRMRGGTLEAWFFIHSLFDFSSSSLLSFTYVQFI